MPPPPHEAAERATAAVHQAEFVAWLRKHGVDLARIDLVPAPSGLSWGAFAARDLPAGTACATIPLTLALTEVDAVASRTAIDAKSLGLAPSTRTLTYVEMVLQRADRSSHFGPYLRAIPVRHTDPVSWPEEGLQMLRGSNLLPATRRVLAELRVAYDALVPALCRFDPARYPVAVLEYSQFLWAHSSFVSRAFPLTPDSSGQLRLSAGASTEDTLGSVLPLDRPTASPARRQQCLLPLLDMFNHRNSAPIVWESGGGPSSTGGRPSVGFAAGKSLSKGQEVFNNYGPKGNEELLLTYGFVLHNNPHDAYFLEAAGVAAEDEEELLAKQTVRLSQCHSIILAAEPPRGLTSKELICPVDCETPVAPAACAAHSNTQRDAQRDTEGETHQEDTPGTAIQEAKIPTSSWWQVRTLCKRLSARQFASTVAAGTAEPCRVAVIDRAQRISGRDASCASIWPQ